MHYKHFTLLLLAAVTFFSTAIAQTRIKDQKVLGGNSDDGLSCMYRTQDGGLIVGGASESGISGQKSQKNKGKQDYWVVKLDSNKRIQWDKTIGGSSDDNLSAIQQTADGGYILGGYSASGISGDKTESNRGTRYDYWVVKLDSNGTIQWDKTIGGSGNENFAAIQQTTDGGYIVGGTSSSNISGEKTQNKSGISDYWIVKLNSSGNILWDKTIGGSGGDDLSTIQQTPDGGYILGGFSDSDSSGDKTENSRGSAGAFDYWIVKTDANGNKLWDKTIGGSGDDELYALQQTTDGGYVLGGFSNSNKSGDKTENSRGNSDYWIVKLDENWNKQWDKTIGGSSDDELLALRQTSDGGYLLAGFSYSNISGEKSENSRGERDYWVVKTNSIGKVQGDKTIGGNDEDNCSAILEIKNNDYIVGGTSYSGISGDKTIGTTGRAYNNDYWLVELKYVKPDSVAVAQVATSRLAAPQPNATTAFSIYPNPATSVLHIQNMGKTTFVLTDVSGKRILSKTMDGNGDINVANIPSGTYYLTNITAGITQKVIITK